MSRKSSLFLVPAIVILVIGVFFYYSNTGFTATNYDSSLNGTCQALSVDAATLYGKVRGYEAENNTWAWKGIPFAKPPVDKLRWKAPQNPEPWSGIKNTVTFATPAIQYDGNPTGPQSVIGSEDCLYLNIWRPRTQRRNLPVYFWIHGGGNSIGGAEPYPGQFIAGNGNLVVVTIQYRLGPLGWFTHPDLRKGKNPMDASGNFGTLDIIQALKWVKQNIRAFGGNPHNIMITGESAGALNVYSLVISRLAGGLFEKAMVESSGQGFTLVQDADTEANIVISTLLEKDGLTEVPGGNIEAYLRGKSAAEIMQAYTPAAFGIIRAIVKDSGYYGYRLGCFRDGVVIPKAGIYALANPCTYNQVPLIAGANKEETKFFNWPLYATWNPADWGGLSYQQYNLNSSRKWINDSVDIPVAMMRSHPSQPPIYAYQLNYGAYHETGYNAWPNPVAAEMFGACHTLDVPLLWKNYPFLPPLADLFRVDNRAGYEALSDDMMAFVAKFAHSGNPGTIGGVTWKPWSNTPGQEKRILFDADATNALIEMSNH